MSAWWRVALRDVSSVVMARLLVAGFVAVPLVPAVPMDVIAQVAPQQSAGVAGALVSGTVRRGDGAGIAGADIMVSTASGHAWHALSGKDGSFRLDSLASGAEYLLSVSAVGYRSIRRRLMVDSTTPSTTHVVLVPFVDEVGTVVVKADRAPLPSFSYEPRPGSTATIASGVQAVTPITMDGVAEMLRNNLWMDGIGAFGLNAGESAVQLNGLASGLAVLPRSLPVAIQAGIGEYDVSIGGFSGARIALDVQPATEFARRFGHFTWENRRTGARSADARLTGTGVMDVGGSSRWRLSGPGITWGARAGWTARPTGSLENDNRVPSFRSAAMARELWQSSPLSRMADVWSGTSLVRIDFAPDQRRRNAFIGSLGLVREAPYLGSVYKSASFANQTFARDLTVQHLLRRTRGRTAWDMRSSVSETSRRASSPATARTATIHLPLTGTPDAAALQSNEAWLGGSGARGLTRSRSGEAILSSETALGAAGRWTHVALFAGRRSVLSRESSGPVASLRFSSPTAFVRLDSARAAITPALHARGETDRLTMGTSLAGAITPTLKIMSGIRADAQWIGTGPDTRRVLDLEPRFGLTWVFRAPTEGAGFLETDMSTRHLIPPGVLRIGAGQFVSDANVDAVALPGGELPSSGVMSCWLSGDNGGFGDGSARALEPDELLSACQQRGGSETATRAALAPGYRPSRSTRATFSFLTRVRTVDMQVEGLLAFNDRQPLPVDRTVPREPLVQLPGGASLFVPLSSIRVTDGVVVRPTEGAFEGLLARDLRVESTGRARAQRLVVTAAGENGRWRTAWRLGYALGSTVSLENGFQRDAAANPWRREWAPARNDRRHQVQAEIGRKFWGVYTTVWVRAMSGLPYSPLVDGDVNGDGGARNDRVSATIVASLDSDLRRILSRSGMACITRDLVRNQRCRGPWDVGSGLAVKVNPWHYFGRPGVPISLVLDNPLALFGQWTGSNSLQAFASGTVVDPVLLRPVGFSVTDGFRYSVNPMFGYRQAAQVAASGYRVSLSVRVPLAPAIERQQLDRWLAARGVGQRLSADELGRRFARNVPNMYNELLDGETVDALLFTRAQRDTLETRRMLVDRRLAAIWRSLGESLVATGERRGSAQTLSMVQRAVDAAWEVNRLSANELARFFSPIQEALLPGMVKLLLHAKEPLSMRITYY